MLIENAHIFWISVPSILSFQIRNKQTDADKNIKKVLSTYDSSLV